MVRVVVGKKNGSSKKTIILVSQQLGEENPRPTDVGQKQNLTTKSIEQQPAGPKRIPRPAIPDPGRYTSIVLTFH